MCWRKLDDKSMGFCCCKLTLAIENSESSESDGFDQSRASTEGCNWRTWENEEATGTFQQTNFMVNLMLIMLPFIQLWKLNWSTDPNSSENISTTGNARKINSLDLHVIRRPSIRDYFCKECQRNHFVGFLTLTKKCKDEMCYIIYSEGTYPIRLYLLLGILYLRIKLKKKIDRLLHECFNIYLYLVY